MVAVAAAALVLASAVVGQARERTTLFVPSQPIPGTDGEVPPGGATVSCTDTPFVLFIADGPITGGTCTFEHFGRPGGNLVCDEPTTLFLRPPPDSEIDDDIAISAFVCSVPVEMQSSSPAPVTQEGDQESDSGEVGQSFDVS
jgi:hypothetical protein